MSDERRATITRKTGETDITLSLNLDRRTEVSIKSGIPFFDHMLHLLAFHGGFALSVEAKGDLDVDFHHTVEDIGICFGQALRECLGVSKGIRRYASGLFPMDEALAQIAIDISNRPYLGFSIPFAQSSVGTFDCELVEEFFRAFSYNAKLSLHIDVIKKGNTHHMIESAFKGTGICLGDACRIDSNRQDIRSTKHIL